MTKKKDHDRIIVLSRHTTIEDHRRAAMTICSEARDAAEARELLDMLGLNPVICRPTQKAASE